MSDFCSIFGSYADTCRSIFYSGKAQGTSRCGDISEACQDKRPRYAWIEQDPSSNYDYSNPKTVTYKIHGIANCDWTLDSVEVTAYFGSEKKTATLEKGATLEGHETKTAVFKHQFNTKIQGKIPVFITGANGNTRELDLYPPLPKDTTTTTKTQCEYANNAPSGSISIASSSMTSTGLIPYGANMTVSVSAYDCDGLNNGAKLSAHLQPFANTYLKMTNGGIVGGRIVFSRTIKAENLAKPLCAKLSDEARGTSTEVCTSDFTIVPASSSSSSQPSAVIGSGLKYSYHVGDTASNITAYSDDSKASFKWTVTRPDGKTADTYTAQTISSYSFSSAGTYYFKLEVTAADGKTKTTTSRSVNVYPKSTPIPSAVINNLSYSYYVGDTATSITGYSDDSGASFAWIVTGANGTLNNYTGKTISSYTFNQQGNVNFKLIVTASDGKTTNAYNQSVGVYQKP